MIAFGVIFSLHCGEIHIFRLIWDLAAFGDYCLHALRRKLHCQVALRRNSYFHIELGEPYLLGVILNLLGWEIHILRLIWENHRFWWFWGVFLTCFQEKFFFLDWYKKILDFGSFGSYFKLRRKLHFQVHLRRNSYFSIDLRKSQLLVAFGSYS